MENIEIIPKSPTHCNLSACNCVLPNSSVEGLTPSTSEREGVWRQGLEGGSQGTVRLLGGL